MKNMKVCQKVENQKAYGVHALEKIEKKVAYSSFFKEKSSLIQKPGSIAIATNTTNDEKCDHSNNNEHFKLIQCGQYIKQETGKENETNFMKQHKKLKIQNDFNSTNANFGDLDSEKNKQTNRLTDYQRQFEVLFGRYKEKIDKRFEIIENKVSAFELELKVIATLVTTANQRNVASFDRIAELIKLKLL